MSVISGGSLTLDAINAPGGLTAKAAGTISAGPAIGNDAQAPVSNWTPSTTWTAVPAAQAFAGGCTPSAQTTCQSAGTGMAVNITVNAQGSPTATLATYGNGYTLDDVVVFDPPDGVGTPLRVQVTSTPDLEQSNNPVNWSPWTASETYAGISPSATSQQGCDISPANPGVTSCTSAGSGFSADIAVDQYGNPSVTVVTPGSGYAFGDTLWFEPPDGHGTPIEIALSPVLVQSTLPGGFLPWTASQSYSQVQSASTSGAGSGLTASVTVDANGIPTLALGAVIGTGYQVGDTITFDPPDGIGDAITATITPALSQSALPSSFTAWTPSRSYALVQSKSTSGAGSGLTASITVDANGIPALSLAAGTGSGYRAGDTVAFEAPDGIGTPVTATITDAQAVQQVNVNWLPNQTWTSVAASTANGPGSGLTVTITTDSQGLPSIVLLTPGAGYQPGETLTFNSLGPAGAAADKGNTADPIIAQYLFVGGITQLPGAAWTPDATYTGVASTGGGHGTGMTVDIATDDSGTRPRRSCRPAPDTSRATWSPSPIPPASATRSPSR